MMPHRNFILKGALKLHRNIVVERGKRELKSENKLKELVQILLGLWWLNCTVLQLALPLLRGLDFCMLIDYSTQLACRLVVSRTF